MPEHENLQPNPENSNAEELTQERIKGIEEVRELRNIYSLSKEERAALTKEDELSIGTAKDKILAAFKNRLAGDQDWVEGFMEQLEPEERGFFERQILEPLQSELAQEASPPQTPEEGAYETKNPEEARAWLERAAKRGIIVQGIERGDNEAPTHSDLDGNLAIDLLMKAGVVGPDTPIHYVAHKDLEAALAKHPEAGIMIDITSRNEPGFAGEAQFKTQHAHRDWIVGSRALGTEIDREKQRLYLDHHGPYSDKESASAAKKTWLMLDALGYFEHMSPEAQEGLRNAVEFVQAEDNKDYLKPGFDPATTARNAFGLKNYTESLGTEGVKHNLGDLRVSPDGQGRYFDKRFGQLMEATGGDAGKELTDAELAAIDPGLVEASAQLAERIENAKQTVQEWKGLGFILETPAGQKIFIDRNDRLLKQLRGTDYSSILYAQGVDTMVRYFDKKKGGVDMFITTQDPTVDLDKLAGKYGGERPRNMYVRKSAMSKRAAPTIQQVLGSLGVERGRIETGLDNYRQWKVTPEGGFELRDQPNPKPVAEKVPSISEAAAEPPLESRVEPTEAEAQPQAQERAYSREETLEARERVADRLGEIFDKYYPRPDHKAKAAGAPAKSIGEMAVRGWDWAKFGKRGAADLDHHWQQAYTQELARILPEGATLDNTAAENEVMQKLERVSGRGAAVQVVYAEQTSLIANAELELEQALQTHLAKWEARKPYIQADKAERERKIAYFKDQIKTLQAGREMAVVAATTAESAYKQREDFLREHPTAVWQGGVGKDELQGEIWTIIKNGKEAMDRMGGDPASKRGQRFEKVQAQLAELAAAAPDLSPSELVDRFLQLEKNQNRILLRQMDPKDRSAFEQLSADAPGFAGYWKTQAEKIGSARLEIAIPLLLGLSLVAHQAQVSEVRAQLTREAAVDTAMEVGLEELLEDDAALLRMRMREEDPVEIGKYLVEAASVTLLPELYSTDASSLSQKEVERAYKRLLVARSLMGTSEFDRAAESKLIATVPGSSGELLIDKASRLLAATRISQEAKTRELGADDAA